MQDIGAVGEFQCTGNLRDPLHHQSQPTAGSVRNPGLAIESAPFQGRRQISATEVADLQAFQTNQDLIESQTLHQFHGKEVLPVMLPSGIDRYDRRMLQAGNRCSLPLKTRDGLVGHGKATGQDLESHPAIERQLTSLIDHAHASPPDLADDFEIPHHDPTGICSRTALRIS